MNLFKTSFWSAISSTFRIIAGMVTTKIMAIYVGPAGIALLGNFNNITNILSTFSNGAISSGIIKYISEYKENEDKRSVVFHGFWLTLICSILIGFGVLIFNKQLSRLAFGDTKYTGAFVVFGFTIIFYGFNLTITAILNGYREIKYMIITGMIGSALSILLAILITIRFGLFGALVNASIAQVFIFLINIRFVIKLKIFSLDMLRININRILSWKLLKYAAMSIISILVVPTSTLLIRKYIFTNFTPNEAGYIQGVWSISGSYLAIVTTTLSIYYLPTLSEIKTNWELRKEIIKGYKFILPLAVVGGLAIFMFRDLIINVLYTPEFMPMKKYFTFQIIGDTLKIASWILGFIMVAKAMTRVYIVTEIIFAILNVALSVYFMNYYGSIGVMYGYTLTYFIFLIFLITIFRKLLFQSEPPSRLN
jgi:PST family polysaccharide transporter